MTRSQIWTLLSEILNQRILTKLNSTLSFPATCLSHMSFLQRYPCRMSGIILHLPGMSIFDHRWYLQGRHLDVFKSNRKYWSEDWTVAFPKELRRRRFFPIRVDNAKSRGSRGEVPFTLLQVTESILPDTQLKLSHPPRNHLETWMWNRANLYLLTRTLWEDWDLWFATLRNTR